MKLPLEWNYRASCMVQLALAAWPRRLKFGLRYATLIIH